MKCEKCRSEHDGSYGSGRFCSAYCARSFSTSKDRANINSKISISVKSLGVKPPGKIGYSKKYVESLLAADFDTLRPTTRRNRVILEQNFTCLFCNNDEWMGFPITLELDHIDGDNTNNTRSNLRALCPNCHALTPTWRGKTKGKISRRESKLALFREWLKDINKPI